MSPDQIRAKIASLLQTLALLINSRPTSMKEQLVYQKASASLGKHMTLNEAVPHEVGCAEAVSAVLALAGISTGSHGIAGTASLDAWLASNANFERIGMPEAGAIIVSATGTGNGSVEGHTGFFGLFNKQYPGDWGVLSNDSATGLFMERWSWTRWQAYYKTVGGLNVHIYRAK